MSYQLLQIFSSIGEQKRCCRCGVILLLIMFPMVVVTTAFMPLRAAPLFIDDFSSEAQSSQNWVVVSSDDRPLKFSHGSAVLENSSAENAAFALHSLRTKTAAVSFSCRIVSDLPGAGIFYGADKNGAAFRGYAVVAGAGTLLLLEYGDGGQRIVREYRCPFLLSGGNVLTVGGDSLRLRVFCNGYFQFSFDNNYGRAGKVAVLAPPASSVEFDDVSVVDTVADSTLFPVFADPLTTTGKNGWTQGGYGAVERGSAGLQVETAARQEWFDAVMVPIADGRIAVSVERAASGGDGTVGLFYSSGGSVDSIPMAAGLRFGLAADGRYVVKNYSAAESFTTIAEGVAGVSPSGSWDTLVVSKHDSVFTFSINATSVRVGGDRDCIYTGGGFFASGKNSITFCNFLLVDHYELPVSLIRPRGSGKVVVTQVPAFTASFDLLGRIIVLPENPGAWWGSARYGVTVSGTGGRKICGIQKK